MTTTSAAGRAARAKGAVWERAVAVYLSEHGFPGCARNLERRHDQGDILGLQDVRGGVGIECKAQRALDLSGWLTQAQDGATRAGLAAAAVVIKRRGVADPGQSYVLLDLETFARLVKA